MFDELTQERSAGRGRMMAVRATIVVADPSTAETEAGAFDALIGDGRWRVISLEGVEAELKSVPPRPRRDELYLFTLAQDDDERIERVERSIGELARLDVATALITDHVASETVHRLLRAGAIDFTPWPVPKGGLDRILDHVAARRRLGAKPSSTSQLISVFRAAGGAGATTLAVNLAWELALAGKGRRGVALIDLDLQFGGVSGYLEDAPGADIAEMLLAPEAGSANAQRGAMTRLSDKLAILPAPTAMLPLHSIARRTVDGVLVNALASFDYVVVDTPLALTTWTKAILERSTAAYLISRRLDHHEENNVAKMLRAFDDIGAPTGDIELVLNQAPAPMDFGRRRRAAQFQKNIARSFDRSLPDGGGRVAHAGRQGALLADVGRGNRYRCAVRSLAKDLVEATPTAPRTPLTPAQTPGAVQAGRRSPSRP